MKNMIESRTRSLLVVAPALLAAVALSACGSFDSKASGEHLINQWVPGTLSKGLHTPLKVASVSCPSGIKDKVGNQYDCKATIEDTQTHKSKSGTITIHITKDHVVIRGLSDLHGFQ
jgi:hypothetical protein